jgi:formate hydrogenlyase subunit 4
MENPMTVIAILVTIATALATAALTYGIHNHRHIRDLERRGPK